MNFLTKALHSTGVKMASTFGGGGHEGAQSSRRLKLWNATAEHVNGLLSSQGETLRARCRHIVRTNPLASNGSDIYAAYSVGNGIRLLITSEDEKLQKEARRLWRDFVISCDADGNHDFYGLQSLAPRALFEAGEIFYRFRPRRMSDGFAVPLQIQALESEMLPYRTETLANGNVIRCGVEFDKLGIRVAYHFYRNHPGDHTDLNFRADLYTRVPAREVLHVYRAKRPGQIRGEPTVSPSLVRLYLLDQYEDAEIERKKTAALFTGFILQQLEDGTGADQLLTGLQNTNLAGIADYALEPGTINILKPGESFESSQPADVGGNYDVFMYQNKTAVVAGWGLPYGAVTGDLRESSYSVDRAEQLNFKRKMSQLQNNVLIFKACRPVAERFFDIAVLSGALKLPRGKTWREVFQLEHIPPQWPWIDPAKDRKAMEIALDNNIISQSHWIISEGGDPDDVFDQIKKDNATQLERGITPPTKKRSGAARMPDLKPIKKNRKK